MEKENKNILLHKSKCQIKAKFIGDEKRFSSKLKKGMSYLIDVRLNSFGGIETNSLSDEGKWLNYWGNLKDFTDDWDFDSKK